MLNNHLFEPGLVYICPEILAVMPNVHSVRNGLDLPILGAPEAIVDGHLSASVYAVRPSDFRGLAPKLAVKEGDRVLAGDILFTDKANPQIAIASPVSGEVARIERGDKRKAVEHALANAREALVRRRVDDARQAELLAGVAAAFGLPAPPERVEVYDNSHIMGRATHDAMVSGWLSAIRFGTSSPTMIDSTVMAATTTPMAMPWA